MNVYIVKELKLLGWQGPDFPSKRYWQYGVFEKVTT